MGLKFRRGSTAQQSGSLAFGEPYVNTTLGTLVVGGATGDIVLSTSGTGSTGNFGAISGSGLDITGNANIGGNLSVAGQLTIGDNTSDTVNVVASLSSSLIPSVNDAFDLGSATKIWRDLYISTGSIKMYDGAGNLISTLSATANGMRITGELSASTINGLGSPSAFSSSIGTKFNTLGTYTASVDTSISNLNTTTASLNISVSNLNTYTGSNDTTNTTQTSRLDQLSTASGSAITRLTALEVETSNLETFSGSALTRLTALEVETSNLETFTASLSTTSNVRFGSLGIGMASSGTSGRIDAANDVVAFSTSDIRLKENIVPIPNALEKISKISGNTYDWRTEFKDVHGYEGNDVGVIAQEVEAVLPQLVQDRDNGYKAVKYDKLVALLIEGIKEQQTQIHSLTLEIEKLKEQKGL